MNRTIKFRGKLLDGGRWLYGDLISFGDERWINCNGVEKISDTMVVFNARAVDPETVGQFTGLLDKDGKEIWEGDIMQICKDIAVVVFSANGFYQKSINDGPTYCNFNKYEVIGNMHDNPELVNPEIK